MIYLNGRLIPANKAQISIMDNGFLFGYGVFGVMRVYESIAFRLESQLDRLKKSLERLGISIDIEILLPAIMATIQANSIKEGYVRITISAGVGTLIPDPHKCTEPTVVIMPAEYTPPSQDQCEKGFRAMISSFHRHSGSPISEMKTLNYLESMLARQEARMADYNEAILLNDKGFLSESSSGNVFIFKDNILKTPEVNSGFISGIVREVILEISPLLNVKVVEADIHLDDLLSAEEAFLTNSIIEVMPLVTVNDQIIGNGKPGIITKKLMEAFRNQVIKETRP